MPKESQMDDQELLRLARWQGGVEQQMQSLEERATDLERERGEMGRTLVAVQVQLSSLKTMVGVWSALGGVIGAGIATVIATALTGGHL